MLKILYTLFFFSASLLSFVVSTDANSWNNNLINKIAAPVGLFGLPLLCVLTVFLFVFILKNHWGTFFIGLLLVGFSWLNVTGYSVPSTTDKANLSVLTLNVLWNNPNHYEDAKNKIMEMSPDIVILEEYNKDTDLVGLYTSYPYRADGEEGNLSISNTVILSKYPFASQESHPYMSSSLPSVEIIVSGTSVAIMGVHTMSPTSHERTIQWLSDLSEVGKWAVENKDKNIIIAGDFNANTSMKPFRDMVQIGELYITNKFIPTWGFESFKTGLIDNVLVSKNIQLKKIEVKDVVGSDHALTYVELQIP